MTEFGYSLCNTLLFYFFVNQNRPRYCVLVQHKLTESTYNLSTV